MGKSFKDILISIFYSIGVGKSSLLIRYAKGKFEEHYTATIGVEISVKELKIDNVDMKLTIWDTAG